MENVKLKLFWIFVMFAQCHFSVCAPNQTNICDTYGLCSQRCTQKDNTFECSCTQGFQLAPDNRTCNPIDESWKLVYTSLRGLHMIIKSADNQENKLRISLRSAKPDCATYDARNNMVYWTNSALKEDKLHREFTIQKARFTEHNFSDIEIVANAGLYRPTRIAFDWITGNVYFVNSIKWKIVVCGNTTNLCAVILQNTMQKPRDIALHPNLGIMFWTDYGATALGIWRAQMDGESPIRIVSAIKLRPASIVIDQGNDRLYWADAHRKEIASCRFDGTDQHVVISLTSASDLFEIGLLGHRLFWIDERFSQLKSADKFNGTNPEVHERFAGWYEFHAFAVMHLANQPITRNNPCQNHPCSHICTLKSNSFRCLCPVGLVMKADSRSCADDQPKVVVGFKNVLKFMRINAIGKNVTEEAEIPSVQSIDKLVYNPISGSLVISDVVSGKIIEYFHQSSSGMNVLLHVVRTMAMDIDAVSENLYWVDETKQSLNVLSLSTGAHLTLRNLTQAGQYRNLVVDYNKRGLYLTRGNQLQEMGLDGTYARNLMTETNPLSLSLDISSGHTFWMEDMNNTLKFGTVGGNFSTLAKYSKPLVEFAKHGDTIYYTTVNSSSLTAKSVDKPVNEDIPLGSVKEFARIVIMDPNTKHFARLRGQHDCSPGNPNGKNCSHICLPTTESLVGMCKCPANFSLQADNNTCVSDSSPLECIENHSPGKKNCEEYTNIIWIPIIILATFFGIACIVVWCTRNRSRFQNLMLSYRKTNEGEAVTLQGC